MVSYGDFHRMPAARRAAMDVGIRAFLNVPDNVSIFLDNGSFYFLRRDGHTGVDAYMDFVRHARPDWFPVPRDVIPNPSMSKEAQMACLTTTMEQNRRFSQSGYVPVIHICDVLDEYLTAMIDCEPAGNTKAVAIGGIVPNLLRAPKARPYRHILDSTKRIRETFKSSRIHVFGIGGTATLHLAYLLQMDSVDSSGWRNRAARGIIQLPGRGDRLVAELGSWRGRRLSREEHEILDCCNCPGCRAFGIEGLSASGIEGFSHRAAHNLYTLVRELQLIESNLRDGTYNYWYATHLNNSIYRPLVEYALNMTQPVPCNDAGPTIPAPPARG